MALWQHTEKMTVVFMADTGHTLGGTTHLGNADAEYEAEDLVGSAMHLLWPPGMVVSAADQLRSLQISADYVAAASVDFDGRVFQQPLGFRIAGDAESPVLAEESSRVLPAPVYDAGAEELTITHGVPLDAMKNQTIPYVIVFQNASNKKVFASQWVFEDPAPSDFLIENAVIPAGDYAVFVAIKGFALYYDKVTV